VNLHAYNQADGHLKTQLIDTKLTSKKPLPAPALAVTKPGAISCKLICSQSSSLVAQNSVLKKNNSRKITTAGTGSGYEQCRGPSAESLHASNQADGHLNTQLKENQFTSKKPLPVPAVAVNKPRSMSCEHTCSQSSSLIAQNSIE
jgi:hypothetical protein